MKLPRRQFLHLAAGAAALPAVSRFAWAQAYPTRPVRLIVPVAPDRSVAVGTARPAIRNRQQAGWRHQHRHRSGRARACRRLHAAHGRELQRDQRGPVRQAQLQFHPRHRAGRGRLPRSLRHGGEHVGSGQHGSRVHRLRQGQSRQNQHGVVGRRRRGSSGRRAFWPASTWSTCPIAVAGRRSPISSPGRCRSTSPALRIDSVYQGWQAAPARSHRRNALGRATGHPDSG